MPRMVLTMDEVNGSFNLEGPLENKFLCYGMLELAKEVVSKHQPSKILRPVGMPVPPPPGNSKS